MIKTYKEYSPEAIKAMEWTGEIPVNSIKKWNPDIRCIEGKWCLYSEYEGEYKCLKIGDFIIKDDFGYTCYDSEHFKDSFYEVPDGTI